MVKTKTRRLVFLLIFAMLFSTATPVFAYSLEIMPLMGITYIDANGQAQTTNVPLTAMQPNTQTLNSGWFAIDGIQTFTGVLTVSGTVHIILLDGANWTINNGGIRVTHGNTLHIYAQSTNEGTMGSLSIQSNIGAAAIGGTNTSNQDGDAGTIIINGGTITASAVGGNGFTGAGIGGGSNAARGGGSGGNITINGGIVNANGGAQAAGIGGGGFAPGGSGGNITINGGTVTATGGADGAGIGGGAVGTTGNRGGGNIIINSGTIEANGGIQAAGIGSGGSAGISAGQSITINNGTVIANGGNEAAGIGGGIRCSGGTIIIGGGNVTANGGNDGGAGIGGGVGGSGGTVTITGGTVTANGNGNGTGIGGGNSSGSFAGNGGNVTISGGRVTATGAGNGAGIGGAGAVGTSAGMGGSITISGGTIEARGGSGTGAGIGGGTAIFGTSGAGGDVIINGGSVNAVGGAGGGQSIGPGNNGASGTLTDGNGNNVFLNTLTVTGQNIAAVANVFFGTTNTYGTNDIYTDSSGRLFFFLHASTEEEIVQVIIGTTEFHTLPYTRGANHDNAQNLIQSIRSIELSVTSVHNFDSAYFGYEPLTPFSVTITNTGNVPTGALSATLSGTNATSFSLSPATIDSIATSGNGTFTVVPSAGLSAGTYTAIVTITGGGISESFSISFTVNPAQILPLNAPTNLRFSPASADWNAGQTVIFDWDWNGTQEMIDAVQQFRIFVDGILVASESMAASRSASVTLPATVVVGKHDVTMRISAMESANFLESALTTAAIQLEITPFPLQSPTNINITGTNLTWQGALASIENTTHYVVHIAGTSYGGAAVDVSSDLVLTASFDLSTLDIPPGNYSVTVVAHGGVYTTFSNPSVSENFHVPRIELSAPTGINTPTMVWGDTTANLMWDAVPNATGYRIFNGTALLGTTITTMFNLATHKFNAADLPHQIQVVAVGSGYFTDSQRSAAVDFSVTKATFAVPTITRAVQFNDSTTQTVNLTSLVAGRALPTDTLTFTPGAATGANPAIIASSTAVTGGISFTLAGGLTDANANNTAIIPVTISGFTNYQNVTANITVTLTARTPVAITIPALDKTFNNMAVTVTPTAPGISVEDFIFTWFDGNGAPLPGNIAPVNAGDYQVRAAVDTANYVGEEIRAFTISPKVVTVTANNLTITAGNAIPALTADFVGFIGTDNETNAFTTQPILQHNAPNNNTAGTFQISFDTQAVLNTTNGANYTLNHVNGTLTITPQQGGNQWQNQQPLVTTSAPARAAPITILGFGGMNGKAVNIPVTINIETGDVTIELDNDTTNTLIADALNQATNENVQPVVVLDLSGTKGATAAVLNTNIAKIFADAGVLLTLVFDNAQITLAADNLVAIAETSDYDTAITVEIVTISAEKNFCSVKITISIGDEVIAQTAMPFIISLSLKNFDLENINHHRIVATSGNPTIAGGTFDPGTDMFTFSSQLTGEFRIVYAETLKRLTLRLDSHLIVDLAGNAQTQIMDVLPVIQNGRTLVPIRFIAEALGAEVDWIPGTEYAPAFAVIVLHGNELRFPLNGEIAPELAALGMDVPPQVMNNRTMVPLRFITEFFGALVTWDAETGGIEIILEHTLSNFCSFG